MSDIHLFSRFLTNVFFKQTFITMVTMVYRYKLFNSCKYYLNGNNTIKIGIFN